MELPDLAHWSMSALSNHLFHCLAAERGCHLQSIEGKDCDYLLIVAFLPPETVLAIFAK